MHGIQRTLDQISQNDRSLVRAMEEKDYEEVRKQLIRRKDQGEWGYDLDRPFFQQRTYSLYSRYGYEAAASWSELLGEFFVDDPVIPVVHFELASQEGDITGQVMQFMRMVSRVTGRYWDVITSDRVMNDDYNPFIGR